MSTHDKSPAGHLPDDTALGPQDTSPEMHERFTALLMKHHAPLMSYILALLPNWADAEDVMQQASVVLWRKFDEFTPGTEFFAWASQIARYQALNQYRKKQSDRHVFNVEVLEMMADEGLDDCARLERDRHALRACLDKLDGKGRQLIEKCYESGMNFAQIAAQLGCTPNSIYKSLNRLREVLLACIQRAQKAGQI